MIAGCIAVWLLVVALWEILLTIAYYLLEGRYPEAQGPELAAEPGWVMLAQRLNPVEAVSALATEVVGPTIQPALFEFAVGAQRGGYTVAERYHGVEGATEVPFYLEPWFALVVLLAWTAVPLGLGFWRFRSADL